MEEKELKKKILQYQFLQARLEALVKQKEFISQRIVEIESTMKAVSELDSEKEIIFSLGSNSFSKAKLLSNSFFIEIGANILLEKPKEDALKILSERKVELEKSLKDLENEIIILAQKLEELRTELSKSG